MVVEFDDVTKVYGGRWLGRRPVRALDRLSLAIPEGVIFGLLGPNRAGKTTLVKLLLSICRPTSGRISRFGRKADDRRTLARIGYVHDSQAFPRYLTALQVLEFYGILSRIPRGEVLDRARGLLERLGLSDRSSESISRFSKGMLQRLALAQALVNDPELLVLDEPGEGMDLLARRVLHEILRERRAEGRTAILVSHAAAEVSSLCDQVAVLKSGRVAFCGSLDALAAKSSLPSPPAVEESLIELYEVAAT